MKFTVQCTVKCSVQCTLYCSVRPILQSKANKSVQYIEGEGGRVYFLKRICSPLLPLITARLTVQCTVRFTVQYKDYCTVLSTIYIEVLAKQNTKGRKESVSCGLSQIIQSL